MVASVNKTSLNPSKYISAKVWVAIGLLIFLVVFYLVSNQIYKSQPADIVVNAKSLNTAEYDALNQVMKKQEVGNFFTAKLPKIQQVVLGEKWIDQVDIERKWGQGIVVTALPRAPVAKFGSEHYIDSEGVVFQPVSEAGIKKDELIMLQGDNAQSSLIMQQMQQVNQWFGKFDMQVEDIILTPRMTWVIRFDNGLRIIVDNEQTSQKLMNLSQLMENQLAERRTEIASVDLRYKNGFVIAWRDDPVASTELMQPEPETT